jgi:hypothetical protein
VLELERIRKHICARASTSRRPEVNDASENFPGVSDYPSNECDDGAVRNYLVEEQDAGRAAGYVVLAALASLGSVLSIIFVLYLLGS